MPSINERLEHVEKRVTYQEGYTRKRSTALLCLGSCFGLLGFFFAFITGVMKSFAGEEKFPSKRGYFPPTVSEMVHDPMDPAGKAFFAFEFIGAIFIFLSWYPWAMRSVYLGDDDVACFSISWVMLRQFVPAPGMMLVATVTTTPIAQATIRDWFTISIHLSGAMMMFVGYVIIEGKTLGWRCFSPPEGETFIKENERKWRVFFMDMVAFWYIAFFAVQIALGIPNVPICCGDKYSDPSDGPVVLTDTASGLFLWLKILSYAAEVICGINLIMSHLTIWYYCNERHIDLEDELTEMGGYKAPLMQALAQ
mmetsp:Transcript_44938/g.88933  ORF Transcript_44938/g.88933 Transcript_44938/m.88933 type:complete len:309 (+) Transcript_44938:77-1003(+)